MHLSSKEERYQNRAGTGKKITNDNNNWNRSRSKQEKKEMWMKLKQERQKKEKNKYMKKQGSWNNKEEIAS